MSTQNVPGDKEMWKVMLAASGSSQVKWTVIVMIVIIIISTAAWIYSKSKYKEKHCDIIKDVYTDMGKVSSINFFRANRQFIVRKNAIKNITLYFNGRFIVNISPDPKEKIIISKAKARNFKNWLVK